MNLCELIEQSDKRPITPASIDADADVMMYLWANRHAIAELIEAATEWDAAWNEYMLAAKPVTHDRLTKAEERIRTALAKLNGGE